MFLQKHQTVVNFNVPGYVKSLQTNDLPYKRISNNYERLSANIDQTAAQVEKSISSYFAQTSEISNFYF